MCGEEQIHYLKLLAVDLLLKTRFLDSRPLYSCLINQRTGETIETCTLVKTNLSMRSILNLYISNCFTRK